MNFSNLISENKRKERRVDRKPEFFAEKGIKIGIIGCGYVGLPLALRFADVGQRVTGFDTPFPYTLENEYLPLSHRILPAVLETARY